MFDTFAPHPVLTLDGPVTLAEAAAAAEGRAQVAPGAQAAARIAAAHARMNRCVTEGRLVYGVTTGFGPLADRMVSPADIGVLQRNLIYHLATGVGPLLSWRQARAVAFCRLSSIAQGWSGASPEAAAMLAALMNSPYAPAIPARGTVGASGDLTPLAHMALALMGEGGFIDRDGAPAPNEAVFAALGRPPLTLEARDGLALVNGVSAMTGVALLNGVDAMRLTLWAEALTVAAAELLRGRTEAWSPAFARARPHPGQAETAAALMARAACAPRLDARFAAERFVAEAGRAERAPQDAYVLRTAPQVIGAVRDALRWHDAVVERELNAASDNPIFPPEGDAGGPLALHGGNFQGQHVAFASDLLTLVTVALAGLMERQIARLTDERLNDGLPAFLHRGPAGLNSGLMGAQVTATAIVAEMRRRSGPASVHAISTNGANQDVVSLGTIAARAAAEALDDAASVAAILALAAAQGRDVAEGPGMGPASDRLCDAVRAVAPAMACDRPLSREIAAVARRIRQEQPPA
jgi:tyrosine ammonia-lyase